ncbi:hypothetical protein J7T55_001544 [Diaporthe amygdali]|uniref:uncharacterized protein n=1 Tax=Phomopsis amygdali TaxID=1214568 RepID=UPI0022FE121B|nr:uncharacterized protein J7T55_001544 [Diaporthe amygdali]KAJ0115135.1 hypothetical protein J7T55_001544 [Diaporthe amygdali]
MMPFTNVATVVRKITGWGRVSGQRILVVAGGRDRLITMDVMEKLTDYYRKAFRLLMRDKRLDAVDCTVGQLEEEESSGKRGVDTTGDGVRLCVVPSAGHHMQNDAEWEVGAGKLLTFHNQLQGPSLGGDWLIFRVYHELC